MITLQQLLESDSLSTIVAKLNQNFQTISVSNGGPQGIRGTQGIPGLPGRLGPTGVTGPVGPTGTILGIVPFACILGTGPTAIGIGPTSGGGTPVETLLPYGQVGPWPQSSWQWLQYYHTPGGGGFTAGSTQPQNGNIYVDHANNGYWQWLEQPDNTGASCPPSGTGYTASGGAYSYTSAGTYPALGPSGGWGGTGWYFYPVNTNSQNLSGVWSLDYTTYLHGQTGEGPTGPYLEGEYKYDNTTPLTIPNARLLTKYGTVWISSGNDSLDPSSYGNISTSTIGLWGAGPGSGTPQPARANSGIDRLLFKLSLDGLPYASNIAARGYTGTTTPAALSVSQPDYPRTQGGSDMDDYEYWVSPMYNVPMVNYTPLLFFSHRDETTAPGDGTYGSLAYYMYTDTSSADSTVASQVPSSDGGTLFTNSNTSKSLHIMSTRYAADPLQMFATTGAPQSLPINSQSTKNYGEYLLDVRRVIASNQYVCSVPGDLKLSSDYISGNAYSEDNVGNTYAYRTFQGYISAINGKSLSGDPDAADIWEYGLGDTNPGTGNYPLGGIHDAASGTTGMATRNTWYGSSVLATKPSEWDGTTTPGDNDYVRVAGMLERGRKFIPGFDPANRSFLSELIFYTSHFTTDAAEDNVTNDIIDPNTNQHYSKPVLYMSPYRNVGIGTFVGGTAASNDLGPLEPSARLHVHTKENNRDNDPTFTYVSLSAGLTAYANLPNRVLSAAAFTGEVNGSNNYVTDILLGNLSTNTSEYVVGPTGNIVNEMGGSPRSSQQIRNAIRTEQWRNISLNTLRLGAQPFAASETIGRTNVQSYKNEFQLSIHPLTVNGTALSNSNNSVSGVGIQNLYPRTRVHIFGKNLYNETEFGQEAIYASYLAGGYTGNTALGSFPYYGTGTLNSPAANQVVIDYIGDSYTYPVGIYEYQYYSYGATAGTGSTGSTSPNSAVYPNRDSITPTRFAVPYSGIYDANYSWPSATGSYTGSYKHGGVENAVYEPTSYIGFNIFRDISSANPTPGLTGGAIQKNQAGDNRDSTTWVIGTQGHNGRDNGNNGAAALMFSPHGELGFVTIPRGYDGGNAYEQWEQRGLGTRDVLNQMKIIVDKHGNFAIGNGAGWDLDAYPSLEMNNQGQLLYVPSGGGANPLIDPPATGGTGNRVISNWNNNRQYGRVRYVSNPEFAFVSPAAQINKNATYPEYIRLEVGAEKAWSRDGRELIKNGFGYPPNSLIQFNATESAAYVNFTPGPIIGFSFTTDGEGRIFAASIQLDGTAYPTVSPSDFVTIVFPHPAEFNLGAQWYSKISATYPTYRAPKGALAAEWWGMSTDSPPIRNNNYGSSTGVDYSNLDTWTLDIPSGTGGGNWNIGVIPTIDTRGSANMRLNNFVYGEGYGFRGPGGQTAGSGTADRLTLGTYTQKMVKQKRQESPKIILSFLEKDPTKNLNFRGDAGADPYKKVNTVIASAQNESALREYWIPKSDNTGGTFMVFTDHMGSKEKDDGFDKQLTSISSINGTAGSGYTATGNINKLQLLQVVTQEAIWGYTGATGVRSITGGTSLTGGWTANYLNVNMGYVSYYNSIPDPRNGGLDTHFSSNEYGEIVKAAPDLPGSVSGVTGLTAYQGDTAANYASVRRNIDYYYKIFPGSTANYDSGWGNTDIENRATQIRFKRINSDFVLVDFNITVEVLNPVIAGIGINISDYIDFKSPRMTQAIKFMYDVDDNEINTYTESVYGGGPWFSNWSSYRNWIPGAAVVGGDLSATSTGGGQPEKQTQSDSPFFVDFDNGATRTWNGNFLDWGLYPASTNSKINSIFGFGQLGPGSPGNEDNPIRSAFGPAAINGGLSRNLIGTTGDQTIFTAYGGFFYSVWGNHTMSRARNMMWRINPIAYLPIAGITTIGPVTQRRNTFELEIMFDVPIMHTVHAFNAPAFTGATGTYTPYKYLTVSGQSIIRYAQTSRTTTTGLFIGFA